MKRNARIVFIIYARYKSVRLPGKILKKIGNKPVLWYLINRVRLAKKKHDKIIIATSNTKEDKKIQQYANSLNVPTFFGNKNNLIKRTIEINKKYNFDYFVRVCGDRPFFNYEDCKNLLIRLKKNKYSVDLISNKSNEYTPKGMTVEIVNINMLKNFNIKIKNKSDKEHMLNYYYRTKKLKKKIIINKIFKKYVHFDFSINKQKDLDFVNNIYSKVNFNFSVNNKKLLQIIK